MFIASIGAQAGLRAFALCHALRDLGLRVDTDHVGRSMKAQFKYADRVGARFVLTVGEEELALQRARLKNLRDGTEREVVLEAGPIWESI